MKLAAGLLFGVTVCMAAGPVRGFPIGRCVKVAGVTAPEDAKTAGFEYVELALQDVLAMPLPEFELIVKRIRTLGIPALSGYGFVPGELQVVGPHVNSSEISAQIKNGLDRAARLGLQFVVFGNLNSNSRRVPDGFDREKGGAQLTAFAREAADEALKRGITVLIEPLPAGQTNLVNTVTEALIFIRQAKRPNLKLLVDYTYMRNGGENMSVLAGAGKESGQVEVSNPNGRVYPREASESNYREFFGALKRGGYQGGVSVHGKPADFFVDAPRAIQLLRAML